MLRREVVRMAGSLFGLGAGTPSRFPYPDRPQPSPGIGPSQGQVVRARTVIVSGPNGGVFVYSPAPGAGNLIASIAATAGHDPYGNSVSAGFTVYSGATFAEMNAGALEIGNAAAGVTLSIFGAVLSLAAAYGAPSFAVTMPVTATSGTLARPTVISTDTWHVVGSGGGEPAFLNSWANAGGGLDSLQFTLTPESEVHLIGALTPAAITATQVCTLPAGYRPGIGQDFGLGFHTAAGASAGIFGRLTSAGAFSLLNAVTTSGIICVNVKIPLVPTA